MKPDPKYKPVKIKQVIEPHKPAKTPTRAKKLRLTDDEMRWIFETASYAGLNNSRQFPESELVRGIIRGIIESGLNLTECSDEFDIAQKVAWAINGSRSKKKAG